MKEKVNNIHRYWKMALVGSWLWRVGLPFITSCGLFVVLYLEWKAKKTVGIGHASPLFGPFHLVTDVAPANNRAGIILCIILLPTMLCFFFRPNWKTAMISLIGFGLWIVIGIIAQGIGC
jgi:hypothetical protein